MKIKAVVVVALGVMAGVWGAAPARGQYGGGGGGMMQERTVDSGEVKSARSRLDAARRDLNKAKTALAEVEAKLRGAFEATAPWTEAQGALNRASAELAAAQLAVLEQLKHDPGYQAALQARDDADKVHLEVKEDAHSLPDAQLKASTALLEANKALTKMENSAVSADAKAKAAQGKVDAANAAIKALGEKFAASLKTDKDWDKANKVFEDKKTSVANAYQALAAALQREEESVMEKR